MNKKIVLYCCMVICVFETNAQRRPGYFGRKYFIGWEHPIRLLGNTGSALIPQNIGFGKVKVEKLMSRNRLIGFSFESKKYSIQDGLHPDFPLETNPQRYLINRTYGSYLRKYYRARGIAPIGLYVGLNLELITNSVDVTQKWTGLNFGDMYTGVEMGKVFPLIGNRLMANVSVGVNCSLSYLTQMGAYYEYEDPVNNVVTDYTLNDELFIMNILKVNFGLSYALF